MIQRPYGTFGAGPVAIEEIDTAEVLSNSIYIARRVQKLSSESQTGSPIDWFGAFWSGEAPANVQIMTTTLHPLFFKMSNHFEDPLSLQNPYHVFFPTVD